MAGSLKLNAAISQLINVLKEKKRVGNRGLGSVVGISNPHVSRKLNSQYSWNLEEIEKIAKYFGYKDSYSFISKSKKYYGADTVSLMEAFSDDMAVIYDGAECRSGAADREAIPDDEASAAAEAGERQGAFREPVCEDRFRRNEKGEITRESMYGLAARTGDPREKEFLSIQDEPA